MSSQQNALEHTVKFVIVISVIHSVEDLRRCLASLSQLDYPHEEFRVVLINCRVFRGLDAFLKQHLCEYKLQISTLSLPKLAPAKLDWLIEARVNEAHNLAIQCITGKFYVFTEDDCTYNPDWLTRFEIALEDDVGAIGGPDILPTDGLGWFPKSLDCLLNSFLGTAGLRRGDGAQRDLYYPRKENMLIPAHILQCVGNFEESIPVGAEMELTRRIRDAGYKIIFLADNSVWHRRVTTFPNFVRLTAFLATEKVKMMRRQKVFMKSPHFVILVSTVLLIALAASAAVSIEARLLFYGVMITYVLGVAGTAIVSGAKTRNGAAGLGVLLLLPFHHAFFVFGTIRGAIAHTRLQEHP